MIDGIKADDEDSEIIPSQEDAQYEEQKSEKSPLFLGKSQSMIEPPKTDKLYGKRLYSPLANVKRINPKQANKRPYVIGICGGPSSGKSSVTKLIRDKIPHAAIL